MNWLKFLTVFKGDRCGDLPLCVFPISTLLGGGILLLGLSLVLPRGLSRLADLLRLFCVSWYMGLGVSASAGEATLDSLLAFSMKDVYISNDELYVPKPLSWSSFKALFAGFSACFTFSGTLAFFPLASFSGCLLSDFFSFSDLFSFSDVLTEGFRAGEADDDLPEHFAHASFWL